MTVLKEKTDCPFPGTCRDWGLGEVCRRGACPYRIRRRKQVAWEIQKLAKKGSLTQDQEKTLETLKIQYAQLLRGGDPHGRKTQASECPGDGAGGPPVHAGL